MTKKRSGRLFGLLLSSAAIFIGNGIIAFIVCAFVRPHGILIGGSTGMGIILDKVIHKLPFVPAETDLVAAIVFVINIALMILGLVCLGKKFFFNTVASSIIYPAQLFVFQQIPGIDTICDDPTLAAVFSGLLVGIALGMIMRVGASTGGTDAIAMVLNKWFHAPVSVLLYIVDAIIIISQLFFSSPRGILLGILVIIIESIMIEQTMIFGKSMVQIFVVSAEHEAIRNKLLDELDAGVTMNMIETGLLKQQQKGILCVIQPRKVHSAVELIRSVDPHAFVTVTKLKEVRGHGFSMERTYMEKRKNGETVVAIPETPSDKTE